MRAPLYDANAGRKTTGRLDRGDGVELAWARLDGRGPTVVFLPGFRSDMTGDKATALADVLHRSADRPCCASTIPATAPAAAGSRTAPSAAGPTDALAAIDRLTEASWSWSARRWAAGSRCCARPRPSGSHAPRWSASPPRPTSPRR